jgi:hypothetical protein
MALLTAGAVGCSSAADGDQPNVDGFGGVDADGADNDAPAAGDDDSTGGGGSDGAADDAPDPGQNDSAGDDGGEAEMKAGCPAPLPGDWVFCEDFESITDPVRRFFEYADADGRFRLVEGTSASGIRSMESTYAEGIEGAGLLIVSFGASPLDDGARPSYDPEHDFQEIYWRFRVRMEADWPNVGPGRLTRAMSFAASDWSEAFVADIASAGDSTVLAATPRTCIADGTVKCEGYDDAVGLESIGGLIGQTELFSDAASGSWHCVEVHMRLNTPGEVDGALEFWVDDVPEAGSEALDWRGSWTDYGINAVAIENFWPGGAAAPLRRWIDDIVISTAPIGCD